MVPKKWNYQKKWLFPKVYLHALFNGRQNATRTIMQLMAKVKQYGLDFLRLDFYDGLFRRLLPPYQKK